MGYNFNFGILLDYGPYLAGGIWYAVIIAFPAIIIATIVGMVLAAMHFSPLKIPRVLGSAYVDVFRTLPVVVLLIWIHYVLPILTGLSLSPAQSSIMALSMNGSALACEAYRGGLQAISGTQRQAAWSLGLSRLDIMRYVIIPQGFFSTLPALTNVHITIIKNVTVTVLIAVPEVMFRAQELTVQFFRPLELYTGAAVVYVALILSFTIIMRRLEKLRKWESV